MRINPADVFSHTLVSIPARLGLAWLAASLGAFGPVFLNDPAHSWENIPWQGLFFPFYLALIAFASGWWALVAVPLLFVLAWRMMSFMCQERPVSDLCQVGLMAYLISIKACMNIWPYGLLVALTGLLLVIRLERYSRENGADAATSDPF